MVPVFEIELEKLASAHSEQNREANRRWAFCAGLAFLTFNISPSNGPQQVLSTTINTENIFPALVVLLSLSNFIYVVAHTNGFNTEKMFREVYTERKASDTKISEHFNLRDYLNATISSNYNRVAPIFAGIRSEGTRLFLYKITKFVVDTAQIIVPILAIIYALQKTDLTINILSLIWIPAILSILSSAGLWARSFVRIIRMKS